MMMMMTPLLPTSVKKRFWVQTASFSLSYQQFSILNPYPNFFLLCQTYIVTLFYENHSNQLSRSN